MNSLHGLPVVVIDYQQVIYYAEEELPMALQAIHQWAVWFPDHFIILSHTEGDD